jgi:hypothetical protein
MWSVKLWGMLKKCHSELRRRRGEESRPYNLLKSLDSSLRSTSASPTFLC